LSIPVLSGLRELDRPPRLFLLFIVFNVISLQSMVGPGLVLFSRKIGMAPSYVGFLMSFTPLSLLLVVASTRLVTRFGAKRLLFGAWLMRNLLSCGVFLMPWAIRQWGPNAGAYVLVGATFGFCLMRAVGSVGWYPWLHELVPWSQRGAYFSSEMAVTQFLLVLLAVAQALVLRGDPSIARFLLIYSAGIGAGFVSLLWLSKVPGGEGGNADITEHSASAHRVALLDRPFMVFIVVAGLCYVCQTCFASSIVMYMRDAIHLSSQQVMFYMAAGSMAILLTVRHWARYAESRGSGPAMFMTMIGHSMAALLCLTLSPTSDWAPFGVLPVILMTSTFSAAFGVSVSRAMLHFVKADECIGYTNVWTVGVALATGITPIVAGMAIERMNLWGYQMCFLVSGVAGLACALACRLVRDDDKLPEAQSILSEECIGD